MISALNESKPNGKAEHLFFVAAEVLGDQRRAVWDPEATACRMAGLYGTTVVIEVAKKTSLPWLWRAKLKKPDVFQDYRRNPRGEIKSILSERVLWQSTSP